MIKAKPKKQVIYLAVVVSVLLLAAIYFLLRSAHTPHIVDLFETTNGKDMAFCTLENYQHTSKSGPSHTGILLRSFNATTGKEIVHCELSYDSYGSTDKFLGCKNGIAWFARNEKPIMIYVFKEDSVLEEEAAIQVLNSKNPGTALASISYAPTRGVMYANLKNGDQFIIDPFTFKYISFTTELESYAYALKPESLINDENELEVNKTEIIELRKESDSNLGQCLVKKSYTVKDGMLDSLVATQYLTRTKFINAKLALFQDPVLFVVYTDVYGPDAKNKIAAYNISANKLLWTILSSGKTSSTERPKLYPSLNSNYFYCVYDNEQPIKLNTYTGEVMH